MKERKVMECSHKFFKCNLCGNFAGMIHNSGARMVCCGQEMTEIIPNTEEASTEKHIPAVTASGDSISVQVGSVPHPMEEGHHISFIYVGTEHGGQRKCLDVGADPKCEFTFINDKPVSVYAYCNLHGLWEVKL